MSAIIDDAVVQAAYDRWAPLAASVTPVSMPAPVAVIFGESVELGMLYNAYWDPSTDNEGRPLPSFSEVAEKSVLHQGLGSEIYELQAAAAKVQADYTKAVQSSKGSPMVRAEFVMQEIRSALEFVFDDDEHTAADDQLAKVTAAYPSPTSQDVMALALEAYAALAAEHRDAITGLGGFDESLIGEARALAGALRTRSGEALLNDVTSGLNAMLDERNRLLTMLLERAQRVRRAARYVFRAHPETARKFVSSYERSRRRKSRRRSDDTTQSSNSANAANTATVE